MGWWTAHPETGQIDFERSRERAKERKGLTNAIPGKDDTEGPFVGDEPADILGAAIREIKGAYKTAWGREPTMDELALCWTFVFNGERRLREKTEKAG